MKYRSNACFAVCCALLYVQPAALATEYVPNYTTEEFRDKNSRTRTIYMCAHLGESKSFFRETEKALNYFERLSGITKSHSVKLRDDAQFWYMSTLMPKNGMYFDHKSFWDNACEKPFKKIAQLATAEPKTEPKLAPLYESATLEQIGTAKCSLDALPKRDLDGLVEASKRFVRDKDKVRLMSAYQIDSVPSTIGRCLTVYGVTTITAKPSSRDQFHFYDMTERALRALIFAKLAKTADLSTSEMKVDKDLYDFLMKENKAYYQ